jgi:phytoene desaturase
MLLARAGADVTIYEKHARVGGRSATIEAHSPSGTFRFDMGPTFFLYPRVLADIFAACGRDLEQEIDLIRLDPQYELIFEAGGRVRATPDLVRLQEEVARLAPDDAVQLPRYMADNRAKLAAFKPVLEAAFHGMRDLVRPHMLKSLPLMRPLRTVNSDLATYFSDERIRLAFSFQSKYLGMSPYRCPSLFTILAFMEYEFGVFHPRGGCGAVMDTMARVATDLGVDVRLSEPAEEILFTGRRATGVRTADGVSQYDAVVVNADFANAGQTASWAQKSSPAPPS